MISNDATKAAQTAYRETLTELRLTEGGGFNVSSQVRRAIDAALEAAAPYLVQAAKAEAWDEGEKIGYEESFRADDPRPTRNPYR